MDSESDDGFGRQPGEALEMGDDFDDSEEANSDAEPNHPPLAKPAQAAKGPPVRALEVQN